MRFRIKACLGACALASAQEAAVRPNDTDARFIHIEQEGGVWWLIAPDGTPFVNLLLNPISEVGCSICL